MKKGTTKNVVKGALNDMLSLDKQHQKSAFLILRENIEKNPHDTMKQLFAFKKKNPNTILESNLFKCIKRFIKKTEQEKVINDFVNSGFVPFSDKVEVSSEFVEDNALLCEIVKSGITVNRIVLSAFAKWKANEVQTKHLQSNTRNQLAKKIKELVKQEKLTTQDYAFLRFVFENFLPELFPKYNHQYSPTDESNFFKKMKGIFKDFSALPKKLSNRENQTAEDSLKAVLNRLGTEAEEVNKADEDKLKTQHSQKKTLSTVDLFSGSESEEKDIETIRRRVNLRMSQEHNEWKNKDEIPRKTMKPPIREYYLPFIYANELLNVSQSDNELKKRIDNSHMQKLLRESVDVVEEKNNAIVDRDTIVRVTHESYSKPLKRGKREHHNKWRQRLNLRIEEIKSSNHTATFQEIEDILEHDATLKRILPKTIQKYIELHTYQTHRWDRIKQAKDLYLKAKEWLLHANDLHEEFLLLKAEGSSNPDLQSEEEYFRTEGIKLMKKSAREGSYEACLAIESRVLGMPAMPQEELSQLYSDCLNTHVSQLQLENLFEEKNWKALKSMLPAKELNIISALVSLYEGPKKDAAFFSNLALKIRENFSNSPTISKVIDRLSPIEGALSQKSDNSIPTVIAVPVENTDDFSSFSNVFPVPVDTVIEEKKAHLSPKPSAPPSSDAQLEEIVKNILNQKDEKPWLTKQDFFWTWYHRNRFAQFSNASQDQLESVLDIYCDMEQGELEELNDFKYARTVLPKSGIKTDVDEEMKREHLMYWASTQLRDYNPQSPAEWDCVRDKSQLTQKNTSSLINFEGYFYGINLGEFYRNLAHAFNERAITDHQRVTKEANEAKDELIKLKEAAKKSKKTASQDEGLIKNAENDVLRNYDDLKKLSERYQKLSEVIDPDKIGSKHKDITIDVFSASFFHERYLRYKSFPTDAEKKHVELRQKIWLMSIDRAISTLPEESGQKKESLNKLKDEIEQLNSIGKEFEEKRQKYWAQEEKSKTDKPLHELEKMQRDQDAKNFDVRYGIDRDKKRKEIETLIKKAHTSSVSMRFSDSLSMGLLRKSALMGDQISQLNWLVHCIEHKQAIIGIEDNDSNARKNQKKLNFVKYCDDFEKILKMNSDIDSLETKKKSEDPDEFSKLAKRALQKLVDTLSESEQIKKSNDGELNFILGEAYRILEKEIESVQFYNKAKDHNHSGAILKCAHAKKSEKSFRDAAALFEKVYGADRANACMDAADCYQKLKNTKKEESSLVEASQLGIASAYTRLGIMYHKKDESKAKVFYERAIEEGDYDGHYYLAMLLSKGREIEHDEKNPLILYHLLNACYFGRNERANWYLFKYAQHFNQKQQAKQLMVDILNKSPDPLIKLWMAQQKMIDSLSSDFSKKEQFSIFWRDPNYTGLKNDIPWKDLDQDHPQFKCLKAINDLRDGEGEGDINDLIQAFEKSASELESLDVTQILGHIVFRQMAALYCSVQRNGKSVFLQKKEAINCKKSPFTAAATIMNLDHESDYEKILDNVILWNETNDQKEGALTQFMKTLVNKQGKLALQAFIGKISSNAQGISRFVSEAGEKIDQWMEYSKGQSWGFQIDMTQTQVDRAMHAMELIRSSSDSASSSDSDSTEGEDNEPVQKNHVKLLIKAADSKNAQAMYHLGMMYLSGEYGVKKDTRKAISLLQESAGSNRNAQYHLGMIYAHGFHDQNSDDAKARKYLQSAADQSHAKALYELGLKKEKEEKDRLLLSSCRMGYRVADNALGDIMAEREEYKAAHSLYSKAIKLTSLQKEKIPYDNEISRYESECEKESSINSLMSYGWTFENGEGCAQKLDDANYYYSEASKKFPLDDNGCISIEDVKKYKRSEGFMNVLGLNYSYGIDERDNRIDSKSARFAHIPKNTELAVQFFEEAYKKGHKNSAYNLGSLYSFNKDNLNAIKWYEEYKRDDEGKDCTSLHNARYFQGKKYYEDGQKAMKEKEDGLAKQHFTSAEDLFTKASKLQDSTYRKDRNFLLGIIKYDGLAGTVDKTKGLEYIKNATNDNDARAWNKLGEIDSGTGKRKNGKIIIYTQKGLNYFFKAVVADSKNPAALINLGWFLEVRSACYGYENFVEMGRKKYDSRGLYEKALNEITTNLSQNEDETETENQVNNALFNSGMMRHIGLKCKDPQKKFKWIEKAYNRTLQLGQDLNTAIEYIKCLQKGDGTDKNPKKAYECMLKMYEDFKRFDQTFSSEGRYNWYTRMNTQKTACMFDFAEYLYEKQDKIQQESSQMEQLFIDVTKARSTSKEMLQKSCNYMGIILFERSKTNTKLLQKAVSWFSSAIYQGSDQASINLGWVRCQSDETTNHIYQPVFKYKKIEEIEKLLASSKYPWDAMYYLSKAYAHWTEWKFGKTPDLEKSFEWAKKACEGDVPGTFWFWLAQFYLQGKGVEKNLDMAKKIIDEKTSPDGKVASLYYQLGMEYYKKTETETEKEKAYQCLEKCADMLREKSVVIPVDQELEVYDTLGEMYLNGDGVAPDKNKAKEWYDLATTKAKKKDKTFKLGHLSIESPHLAAFTKAVKGTDLQEEEIKRLIGLGRIEESKVSNFEDNQYYDELRNRIIELEQKKTKTISKEALYEILKKHEHNTGILKFMGTKSGDMQTLKWWFKKAANQRDSDAEYILAVLNFCNRSSTQSKKNQYLFGSGVESGDSRAQVMEVLSIYGVMSGKLRQSKDISENDQQKISQLLQSACDNDFYPALILSAALSLRDGGTVKAGDTEIIKKLNTKRNIFEGDDFNKKVIDTSKKRLEVIQQLLGKHDKWFYKSYRDRFSDSIKKVMSLYYIYLGKNMGPSDSERDYFFQMAYHQERSFETCLRIGNIYVQNVEKRKDWFKKAMVEWGKISDSVKNKGYGVSDGVYPPTPNSRHLVHILNQFDGDSGPIMCFLGDAFRDGEISDSSLYEDLQHKQFSKKPVDQKAISFFWYTQAMRNEDKEAKESRQKLYEENKENIEFLREVSSHQGYAPAYVDWVFAELKQQEVSYALSLPDISKLKNAKKRLEDLEDYDERSFNACIKLHDTLRCLLSASDIIKLGVKDVDHSKMIAEFESAAQDLEKQKYGMYGRIHERTLKHCAENFRHFVEFDVECSYDQKYTYMAKIISTKSPLVVLELWYKFQTIVTESPENGIYKNLYESCLLSEKIAVNKLLQIHDVNEETYEKCEDLLENKSISTRTEKIKPILSIIKAFYEEDLDTLKSSLKQESNLDKKAYIELCCARIMAKGEAISKEDYTFLDGFLKTVAKIETILSEDKGVFKLHDIYLTTENLKNYLKTTINICEQLADHSSTVDPTKRYHYSKAAYDFLGILKQCADKFSNLVNDPNFISVVTKYYPSGKNYWYDWDNQSNHQQQLRLMAKSSDAYGEAYNNSLPFYLFFPDRFADFGETDRVGKAMKILKENCVHNAKGDIQKMDNKLKEVLIAHFSSLLKWKSKVIKGPTYSYGSWKRNEPEFFEIDIRNSLLFYLNKKGKMSDDLKCDTLRAWFTQGYDKEPIIQETIGSFTDEGIKNYFNGLLRIQQASELIQKRYEKLQDDSSFKQKNFTGKIVALSALREDFYKETKKIFGDGTNRYGDRLFYQEVCDLRIQLMRFEHGDAKFDEEYDVSPHKKKYLVVLQQLCRGNSFSDITDPTAQGEFKLDTEARMAPLKQYNNKGEYNKHIRYLDTRQQRAVCVQLDLDTKDKSRIFKVDYREYKEPSFNTIQDYEFLPDLALRVSMGLTVACDAVSTHKNELKTITDQQNRALKIYDEAIMIYSTDSLKNSAALLEAKMGKAILLFKMAKTAFYDGFDKEKIQESTKKIEKWKEEYTSLFGQLKGADDIVRYYTKKQDDNDLEENLEEVGKILQKEISSFSQMFFRAEILSQEDKYKNQHWGPKNVYQDDICRGLLYHPGGGFSEKAANAGIAISQCKLGLRSGAQGQYTQAFKWFKKAAEQGDAKAQYELGVMYFEGLGVDKNKKKAFEWYEKAADQGVAKAQNNLGVMYDKGEGVEQDYAIALKWYEKAAEQGDADAQFNLGVMYQKGQGVGQNFEKAAQWVLKTGRSNNVFCEIILQAITVNKIDEVADHLSNLNDHKASFKRELSELSEENATKVCINVFKYIADGNQVSVVEQEMMHSKAMNSSIDSLVNFFEEVSEASLNEGNREVYHGACNAFFNLLSKSYETYEYDKRIIDSFYYIKQKDPSFFDENVDQMLGLKMKNQLKGGNRSTEQAFQKMSELDAMKLWRKEPKICTNWIDQHEYSPMREAELRMSYVSDQFPYDEQKILELLQVGCNDQGISELVRQKRIERLLMFCSDIYPQLNLSSKQNHPVDAILKKYTSESPIGQYFLARITNKHQKQGKVLEVIKNHVQKQEKDKKWIDPVYYRLLGISAKQNDEKKKYLMIAAKLGDLDACVELYRLKGTTFTKAENAVNEMFKKKDKLQYFEHALARGHRQARYLSYVATKDKSLLDKAVAQKFPAALRKTFELYCDQSKPEQKSMVSFSLFKQKSNTDTAPIQNLVIAAETGDVKAALILLNASSGNYFVYTSASQREEFLSYSKNAKKAIGEKSMDLLQSLKKNDNKIISALAKMKYALTVLSDKNMQCDADTLKEDIKFARDKVDIMWKQDQDLNFIFPKGDDRVYDLDPYLLKKIDNICKEESLEEMRKVFNSDSDLSQNHGK